MKSSSYLWIILIFGFSLNCLGCLASPSPQELESADYGLEPQKFEETIKAHMKASLFDPYSAVYEFKTPFKGYYNNPPVRGGRVVAFGYFVPVLINAKNRFGAYVGSKSYFFFFKNERLIGNCDKVGFGGAYYCREIIDAR